MATGEAPVLEALADINAVSLERTELDPSSLILVRLAALIAVDAPASSYLLHIGPAAEAGVTVDQAQNVLVAVAPIVGTPRTASAAAKIVEALGLAIELAEEGTCRQSRARRAGGTADWAARTPAASGRAARANLWAHGLPGRGDARGQHSPGPTRANPRCRTRPLRDRGVLG